MRDLRAMLADLTRPDAGPGKPVDADSGGSASDVPAGDGTGCVRAPQRPEPIRAETLFEPGKRVAFETVLRLARETHALIWDAALAIVRAAPSPLLATFWAGGLAPRLGRGAEQALQGRFPAPFRFLVAVSFVRFLAHVGPQSSPNAPLPGGRPLHLLRHHRASAVRRARYPVLPWRASLIAQGKL